MRKKLPRKYVILVTVTPLIFVLDQYTKMLVLENFYLGQSREILHGFFNLTYIRNTGAAFGLLSQADPGFRVPFFLIVPIFALAVITYIFRQIPKTNVLLSSALSLIVGGAVGNLLDRIRLGSVVDFLDFHWKDGYHFPAFNIADSAICVGVGILILDMFLKKEAGHASRAT